MNASSRVPLQGGAATNRKHARSETARIDGSSVVGSNTFNDSLTLQFDSREPLVHRSDQSCSSLSQHGAVKGATQDFSQAPGSAVVPTNFFSSAMQLQPQSFMSPFVPHSTGRAGMNDRSSAFTDPTAAAAAFPASAERRERRPRKEKSGADTQGRVRSQAGAASLPPPPPPPPHQQQQQQQQQQAMPIQPGYGMYMPGTAAGYDVNSTMPQGSASLPYPSMPAAPMNCSGGGGENTGAAESGYVMVRPEFLQMLLQQHQQDQQRAVAAPLGADMTGGAYNGPNGSSSSAIGHNMASSHHHHAAATNPPLPNGYAGLAYHVRSPSSVNGVSPQQQLPPPALPANAVGTQHGSFHRGSTSKDGARTNPHSNDRRGGSTTSPRIEMLGTPGAYLIHSKNSKREKASPEESRPAQSHVSTPEAASPFVYLFPPLTSDTVSNTTAGVCGMGAASPNAANNTMGAPMFPYCALPPPPPPPPAQQQQQQAASNWPVFPPSMYSSFAPAAHGMSSPVSPYGIMMPLALPMPPPPPMPPMQQQQQSAPLHGRGASSVTSQRTSRNDGSSISAAGGDGGGEAGPARAGSRRSNDGAAGQLGAAKPKRSSGHTTAPATAAAHLDSHAEPKNGANFTVGGWYEGVVKRYNPLRGFGFLTCTHQLRFDLRACEVACTRHADDVHERQQQQDLEKAVAAATSLSDESHSMAEREEVNLEPFSTTCTDGKVTPGAETQVSLRESGTRTPHCSAMTNTFGEDRVMQENADAASNGKTHGTVVYSTMQWYLNSIDDHTHSGSTEGASAESSSMAHANGEATAAAAAGRKLTREAAEVGDIFVHHSCISMDGFRVFVPGTVVRFSVAVLMDTVQAVDVVPLGPEWVKPLPPEEAVHPPLYKVTPTAATVLRYHTLNAESEEGDEGPHSRVGSTSVQWTDMAVIPSAAVPNSIEGRSELLIVRVPPAAPVVPKITVTSTRSGAMTALAPGSPISGRNTVSPPAATTVASGFSSTPAGKSVSVKEAAKSNEVSQASHATATTTTDVGENSSGSKSFVEVVHPDSIAATFRAMDNDRQQALQGQPGAPALSPTGNCVFNYGSESNEELMDGAAQSVPTQEEVDNQTAARVMLEKGSFTDFSSDPIAFSGGGLTSSKNDTSSGNDRAATTTQRSGTGSLNITTGTTTTNPTQSSENTGSNSQSPQNESEGSLRRERANSGTTPTGSSNNQEEPMSSSNIGGQQTSSAGSGVSGHDEAHDGLKAMTDNEAAKLNETGASGVEGAKARHPHGHHHHDLNPQGTANANHANVNNNSHNHKAARTTPSGALDYGSPNLCTRKGIDAFGNNVHAHGSSGCDSEDKDAVTTTSTTRSANTHPDSNPGPTPDWTEVFDRKMANERAKDIMMHKADLKFFPHHSAKSAAAAAVAAAAAAAASSTPRGGGGAGGGGGPGTSGLAGLQPEVVPLSAVGELDSSSSRGVEENEEMVKDGSESRSEAAHRRDHADWDGYEANPSSSQLPTTEDRSGQTGTTETTPVESNTNENPRHGAKRGEKNAEGEKRRSKIKGTMPSLVMVAVEDLPPALAAQVPPGVSIIALPKTTVRELKLKSLPIDAAKAALLSTPAAGASVSIPSSSNPRVPRSSPDSAPWAAMPASPQSPAVSSEGEYYRSLVMAAGNMTTSSDSNTRHGHDKAVHASSQSNGRIVFPFVTEPQQRATTSAAGSPPAARVSAPCSTAARSGKFPSSSALPRAGARTSSSQLSKSATGTSSLIPTAHTSLSSQPVPVPQCTVNMPLPPWVQIAERTPPQQQQQQRGSDIFAPLSPPQSTTPMCANGTFMSLNSNSLQRGASRLSSEVRTNPAPAGVGYGSSPHVILATTHSGSANGPAPPYPYPTQTSSTRVTPGGNSGSAKSSSPWSSTRGRRSTP